MTRDLDEKLRIVESPCTRNCSLGGDDVCTGCNRTIGEIVAWSRSSEHEKAEVLARCRNRRLQHHGRADSGGRPPVES